MFNKIGVVSDPIAKPVTKTNFQKDSILMDILTCENSRSYFCTNVSGKLTVANESVKTIVMDKLYGIVSNKISKMDVEFQEIMKSNGEYTKYHNFKLCDETIKSLTSLIKESGDKVNKMAIDQIGVIILAHNNLIKNQKVFKEAFSYNVGAVKQYYMTIVASIIYATGFIVTSMIDYERRNGIVDYQIIFKNENILERGMPKNMLATIEQFNMDISTNNIAKSVDVFKNTKPKAATKGVAREDAAEVLKWIAIGSIGLVGILMVPALVRYTIYFFMHSKIKLSEYFEQQARFLELNIRRLKTNGKTDEKVIEKQEEYITKLKEFAAKLSGDKYVAEKAANADIEAENRQVVKEADEEAKSAPESDPDANSDSDIFL